jgi:glycosyltransferase (activator-dependent family)
MRVLFVSHTEKTHYFSMVPIAWALRTAGHDVRVACQPELAAAIVESGLVAAPVGTDHRWKQVMVEKNDDTWAERVCSTVTDPAGLGWSELFAFFDQAVTDYFGTVNNDEFIDDLVAYAREWQPDLIVWEQFTWAGAVAAKATGAAHARMLWGADVITRCRQHFLARWAEQPDDQRGDPVAEWLTAALARHGADFDEDIVTGQWTIDAAPPSHQWDLGLHKVPVRYVPYNGPATLPDWLREPPAKPRVCVTAGISVRGYFGFDMFSIAALHAFADLDIEIIATLLPTPGETVDGAPANARVLEFVPMQGLMPTCSAVVHIGGAGVQSTAIHYGVPQLVLPGFWDTVVRGQQLADSGAGLVILPHEITPERVHDDLARLVTDPAFREAAERLRQETLTAPAPNDVVPVLETLTDKHRARPASSASSLAGT